MDLQSYEMATSGVFPHLLELETPASPSKETLWDLQVNDNQTSFITKVFISKAYIGIRGASAHYDASAEFMGISAS